MSITALDIHQQGFEHSLRGYDVEQVDVFLEKVAQEVDALHDEITQLKEQLAAAQQEDRSAELEQAAARIQQAEAAAQASAEQLHAANEATRAVESKLKATQQQVAELERKLAEKSDLDSAISSAFISAQHAADQLKEEARAEGERIYRESEAKAREFIREALIEKQRIINETEALTSSCEKFRNDYRNLLEHFTAEANMHFSDVQPPVVSEATVDAAMPVDDDPIPPLPADSAPVASGSEVAVDELDIEEID